MRDPAFRAAPAVPPGSQGANPPPPSSCALRRCCGPLQMQSWGAVAACLCDLEAAMPWPISPRWTQRQALPTRPGATGHTSPQMQGHSLPTRCWRSNMAQALPSCRHPRGAGPNGTLHKWSTPQRPHCGCVIILAPALRGAITRKACVNGVHRFGLGVHPSNRPMYCWGPWGGGQL